MSTYSTNLKVQLIGTGEENNTWGTVTNNAFSNVFEQAIVGYATVNFSSDANTTLTLTDGNTSQTARNLYLNLTSSGSLTATRDLIIPNNQAGTAPIQKLYIVKNATTPNVLEETISELRSVILPDFIITPLMVTALYPTY